jgi:hypothetical protein
MTTIRRSAVVLTAVLAATFATAISAAGQYRAYSPSGRINRLTGTYQLDRSRSDDPVAMADRALRGLAGPDRDQVSRRIRNRLDPPDVLAIERVGQEVRIASSRAPEMTFMVNGRDRTEQGFGGRTFTTHASLVADRLDVSTHGAAGNDFSVTFESIFNGTALRVTRRLFDDRLRQPVVVQSIYRKTSDTANWDVYAGRPAPTPYGPPAPPMAYGDRDFRRGYEPLVPDGMVMSAQLDQTINLRSVRTNDPITLTVVGSPMPELEGAMIDGEIIPSPAPAGGRMGVTLALSRIRLRDGRTANFDGAIEAVRGPNGEMIPYNGEQVSPNPDQGEQAVERGAIGAALGALIGAVAGGGKGAAVGAVLGGGGAAATVFVDQLNQGDLPRGTEFTIRARNR